MTKVMMTRNMKTKSDGKVVSHRFVMKGVASIIFDS
jgi:hypothetical protein